MYKIPQPTYAFYEERRISKTKIEATVTKVQVLEYSEKSYKVKLLCSSGKRKSGDIITVRKENIHPIN